MARLRFHNGAWTADIVTFNPETGQMKALGPSLDDWATWLLDNPDVNGAAGFAKA